MSAIQSMVKYLTNAKPWKPDRFPRIQGKRCSTCQKTKPFVSFKYGGKICKECMYAR